MAAVTMQEVAELAGVSAKTVSRVINNEPRVKPDTRKRVQKVIDELNFRPNKYAQSLAADRSLLLGLLYDNPSPAYITGLQEGVLSVCNHAGYGLVIHPCHQQRGLLLEGVQKLLSSSRLDGLVLTPPLTENRELRAFLEASKTPYVLISPLVSEHQGDSVSTDDVTAAKLMVQHLVDLGHRRIGFIFGARQRSGSEMRFQGYLQGLRENNIEVDQSLCKEGDFTFESGEAAAFDLLRADNPPTAIFASNDYMAAGVIKAAYQLRISVPYQLSVCGFDDNPIACYLTPNLTTVRHPVAALAQNAAQLLIGQLTKSQADRPLLDMSSELVIRESTARIED